MLCRGAGTLRQGEEAQAERKYGHGAQRGVPSDCGSVGSGDGRAEFFVDGNGGFVKDGLGFRLGLRNLSVGFLEGGEDVAYRLHFVGSEVLQLDAYVPISENVTEIFIGKFRCSL
jgi:hypothetical protein